MILSNPLPGSEINTRSMIITLGHSLLAKGQLYAAQFYYIVYAAERVTYSNMCAKVSRQIVCIQLFLFHTFSLWCCFLPWLILTWMISPPLRPYSARRSTIY